MFPLFILEVDAKGAMYWLVAGITTNKNNMQKIKKPENLKHLSCNFSSIIIISN